MPAERECRFIRLGEDESIVVDLDGREQVLRIAGIRTKKPRPAAYGEVMDRLSRMNRPLRCVFRDDRFDAAAPQDPFGVAAPHDPFDAAPIRARIFYFGWQDKSGDVWLDLAELLVAEGGADPAAE